MTLRVFITSASTQSVVAVQRITDFCKEYPADFIHLEIVDVLERPDAAEADHILATPTLQRVFPLPPIQLVGDLSDREMLRRLLESPDSNGVVM